MTRSELDKQLKTDTDQLTTAHEHPIETLGGRVPDVQEEPPPEEMIPPELILDDEDHEDPGPA